MLNVNYDVHMVILINSIDDNNFMKGVLSTLDDRNIIYNIINNNFFKSTVIEMQCSYKNYLKLMKSITNGGYNLMPLSEDHYIIHNLIRIES